MRAWIFISLCATALAAQSPHCGYATAFAHEVEPYKHFVRVEGISGAPSGLKATLTISPSGDVLSLTATGDEVSLREWPRLRSEVLHWKFRPFQIRGKAATVTIDEFFQLLPPERMPTRHIEPPALGPQSDIRIELHRGGGFGGTSLDIVLTGRELSVHERPFLKADPGTRRVAADPSPVRKLAEKIIRSDFFSMDDAYDTPIFDAGDDQLVIEVDGTRKQVHETLGDRVGMPLIIGELMSDVVDAAKRAGLLTPAPPPPPCGKMPK